MGTGFWEIVVIVVAIVILIRPEKAEEYAKNIGSFIKGVRSVKNEAEEIVKEVEK